MQTTYSFPTGLCKLTQFALISASGDDAAAFLHGQLTNDIKALPNNRACLAGYCSNKGRLLTTLLVWKSGEALMLQLPAALQETCQKRLQMFVLRSKVKLNHVTESHVMLGILGKEAAQQLSSWFPTLPAEPYELVSNEAGFLMRLTDANGMARYQCITTGQLAETFSLPTVPEHVWLLSEIHAGIPHLTLATQEKFVPQMINYELIGGVNFKKGCYPGQEVVARTHYLGKQKRRMVLAQVDNTNVASGTEVFASDDESQPCGMLVNAQPNEAGGSDCLIEIKTAYLNDGVVKLSSGEICRWLAMPYEVPI